MTNGFPQNSENFKNLLCDIICEFHIYIIFIPFIYIFLCLGRRKISYGRGTEKNRRRKAKTSKGTGKKSKRRTKEDFGEE